MANQGLRSEPDQSGLLELSVSDIKQYAYCPRITYFTYVAPVKHRISHKMEHGREEHLDLDRLEKRRKLIEYGLDHGERQFHVYLRSKRLGLAGTLDLLIHSHRGLIPVEFKYTEGPAGLNHKYQLAAYALLVEEVYAQPVRCGFIYLIPGRRVHLVEITPNVRIHTSRLLGAIRNLVVAERFPADPRRPGRCRDCEYLKYCGDVDLRGGYSRVFLVGGRKTAPAEGAAAQGAGDGDSR